MQADLEAILIQQKEAWLTVNILPFSSIQNAMKNSLFIITCMVFLSCNTKNAQVETTSETLISDTAYEISRYIPEPQEIIYNAFIDPDGLQKIWGLTRITLDPRPGEKSFAKMQFGNTIIDFTLTFKEMIPNEKLSWVVQFDSLPGKEISTSILFRKAKGGTDLILRQENFTDQPERDENKKAWEAALMRLEGLISWH